MKQQIISWKWCKSIVKAEAKNWRDLRVAPRLGERARLNVLFQQLVLNTSACQGEAAASIT